MVLPAAIPLVQAGLGAAAGWGTAYKLRDAYRGWTKARAENMSAATAAPTMKGRKRSKFGRKRPRRFRRRFRGRRRRTGIPLRMWRRLRTVMYWSPELEAAGALSQVYLKLNSTYDPTGNIGTSQPYMRDQLAALYKRYQVTSYSVKIEWVTSDNTYPIIVGFTPQPETTALTAYAHYMELPGTVSRMCTMDVDKTILFKSGKVNSQLTPGAIVSDDVLQADVGQDPARVLFGHVWAQVIDAAADAGKVTAVITLTQNVKFFDPITQARS